MPSKLDKIKINNKKLDRRVKLMPSDREAILELKGLATQKSVADLYGVSRRTIQFIWYPEQLEENKKRRAERGGSKVYYDKEKNTASMRNFRKYKKELLEKGEL